MRLEYDESLRKENNLNSFCYLYTAKNQEIQLKLRLCESLGE